MKLVYKRKFDAAHHLGQSTYTKNKNEEVYGKCLNTHGHTWWVEFTVCGAVQETGMLVNFNQLKKLIDRFDHGIINDLLFLPTAENLVSYFLEELQKFDLFTYIKVKVWESDNAYAEDEWRMR